MKLRDTLTKEESDMIEKLKKKMERAKNLDDYNDYKHHIGYIMQVALYRRQIELLKEEKEVRL